MADDDSGGQLIGCVILGALAGFLLGGVVDSCDDKVAKAEDKFKAQAIKHGYAEYTPDDDGKPVWKWKEPKK